MGGLLPPAERRSNLLLAVYAAVSVMLLITGDRLPQAALRGAGAWLFAPFDRLVLAGDRLGAAWRENARLHERITELTLEVARLRAAGDENRQLREELGYLQQAAVRLRPVEVLALSGEPTPSAATLSAGRAQGVREGDIVVTRDGLAGRVTEVYASLSRATLLTDPASAVACEVESTGVAGVIHAAPAPYPRLVLRGVPFSDSVRAGERIVTSGLSRHFPRGIPVGRVLRVGREGGGLMQDVEVAPAVPLARLRHAFVLATPDSLRDRP